MPTERDRELAQEAHCRYCHNNGPDAHPALKCNGDIEDAAEMFAEVRAEGYKQGRVDLNQEWSQELQGALELDVARAEAERRGYLRALDELSARLHKWPYLTCEECRNSVDEWLEARAKEAAP